MEKSFKNDRLLAILRVVIWVLVGLIGFAAVLFIMLAVALPFMGEAGLEDMKIAGDPSLRWAMIAMLVLGVGVLLLALKFFQNLLAIIDTVGEGDPFDPANADRLDRMAWLILYGIGLTFVVFGLAVYVKRHAPDAEITISFDPGIFILVLVLFVLSRVFRHGTEMRRDLEGTV